MEKGPMQYNEAMIAVRHNLEVAHRLSLLPGKCEAIHGHSMWVTLFLDGVIDPKTGILRTANGDELNFGGVKQVFRGHLDSEYDHHVLLNENDVWAQPMYFNPNSDSGPEHLPGLKRTPGDPSTENIALWIAEWASSTFAIPTKVECWETSVNMATAFGSPYRG